MARANTLAVWRAEHRFFLRAYYLGRAVTGYALARLVVLNELPEVTPATENERDHIGIAVRTIGANLKMARGGVAQFVKERLRCVVAAIPDFIGEN